MARGPSGSDDPLRGLSLGEVVGRGDRIEHRDSILVDLRGQGVAHVGEEQAGEGFSYFKPNGEPVRDDATLDRIRKLAVPPAPSPTYVTVPESVSMLVKVTVVSLP